MPAKNTVKTFIPNRFYHVYNRGVEQRTIFLDDRDYAMFLYFLKYYLSPPLSDDLKQIKRSLFHQVKLHSFCLMPNHYHLLVQQTTVDGMTKFIRAVCTCYVGYFNERYNRVGGLFQGKYKASLVDSDEYLLYVTRYIHRNPIELERVGPWSRSDPLQNYPYSSFPYYLSQKHAKWLTTHEILSYFSSAHKLSRRDFLSYESFVIDEDEDVKDKLGELALD